MKREFLNRIKNQNNLTDVEDEKIVALTERVALDLQIEMLMAHCNSSPVRASVYASLLADLSTETQGMYIANPDALSGKITLPELQKRDKPYTVADYNGY
ncbi:MAG: hypothetical protein ABIF40_03425 [archaeon]